MNYNQMKYLRESQETLRNCLHLNHEVIIRFLEKDMVEEIGPYAEQNISILAHLENLSKILRDYEILELQRSMIVQEQIKMSNDIVDSVFGSKKDDSSAASAFSSSGGYGTLW